MLKDNYYAITVVLGIIGGILYRMRGSAWPKWPRPVKQVLFSLLPSIVIPALATYSSANGALIWILTIACMCISVAFECTGHGNFFDLGTTKDSGTYNKEALEWVTSPFYGRISAYWYDVMGLAVTGIFVTVWSGIVLVLNGFYIEGLMLGISGAIKPVGYMAAGAIYGNGTNKAVEYGELLSGMLRWQAACVVLYFMIDKLPIFN